jgi:HK97 family phage prohead protease
MPTPSKKPTINRSNQRREVRVISKPSKVEIRSNADGSRSINGYGVVWDSLSQDMGNWKEKIAPGAFSESLKTLNPDPMILYAHDDASILGRVSSGTATVREDSIGVRFSCQLPNTGPARDLIALAERGDLSSCSFAFSILEGGDEWQEVGNLAIRTVTKAVLWEISIVGQPAYSASSFSLRSCPAALLSKLKRNDDNESEDDDDSDDDATATENENENDCLCDCSECQGDDCAHCSNADCDDENCLLCDQQNRARHMSLILRKMR